MKFFLATVFSSMFLFTSAHAEKAPAIYEGKCFVDDMSKPIEEASILVKAASLPGNGPLVVGDYKGVRFELSLSDLTDEESLKPRRQLTLLARNVKKKNIVATSIHIFSVEVPEMIILGLPGEIMFRCMPNET